MNVENIGRIWRHKKDLWPEKDLKDKGEEGIQEGSGDTEVTRDVGKTSERHEKDIKVSWYIRRILEHRED